MKPIDKYVMTFALIGLLIVTLGVIFTGGSSRDICMVGLITMGGLMVYGWGRGLIHLATRG